MSFYNPNSKYPDLAGGAEDWLMQLLQIYMMNKMYGDQGQPAGPVQKQMDGLTRDMANNQMAKHPLGIRPPAEVIPERVTVPEYSPGQEYMRSAWGAQGGLGQSGPSMFPSRPGMQITSPGPASGPDEMRQRIARLIASLQGIL